MSRLMVVLNFYEDPRVSEREIAYIGDYVYARSHGEEFFLTKNKKYQILDTNGIDMVLIKNDKNIEDWYSVEYFSNYELT